MHKQWKIKIQDKCKGRDRRIFRLLCPCHIALLIMIANGTTYGYLLIVIPYEAVLQLPSHSAQQLSWPLLQHYV